jgi:glycosyltransferase involved in cell wall biosynthesis
MEKIKVTIIIPTVTCPPSLKRAIKSCLDITNIDVEIIVIIDGESEDLAGIDFFNLNLPSNFTIQVFSIPHGGAAAARNRGIVESCGDWIVFLDDDDEIYSRNLEMIMDAEIEHWDLIMADYSTADSQADKLLSAFNNTKEKLDLLKITQPSQLSTQKGFWRYVYKKQFLKNANIEFFPHLKLLNEEYKHEDLFFLIQVLSSNPKTIYVNVPLYRYYVRKPTDEAFQKYLRQLQLDVEVIRLFVQHLAENSVVYERKTISIMLVNRLFFVVNFRRVNHLPTSKKEVFKTLVALNLLSPRILVLSSMRYLKFLMLGFKK